MRTWGGSAVNYTTEEKRLEGEKKGKKKGEKRGDVVNISLGQNEGTKRKQTKRANRIPGGERRTKKDQKPIRFPKSVCQKKGGGAADFSEGGRTKKNYGKEKNLETPEPKGKKSAGENGQKGRRKRRWGNARALCRNSGGDMSRTIIG